MSTSSLAHPKPSQLDLTHLDQSQDGDDQLDRVPQRRIEQSSQGLTHPECRFFRRETQKPSEGDDGDERGDEDGSVRYGLYVTGMFGKVQCPAYI